MNIKKDIRVLTTDKGKEIDIAVLNNNINTILEDIMRYLPYMSKYVQSFIDYRYDLSIPTMATDGENLYINPAFADSLTEDGTKFGLQFVILHELMHCIFEHPSREAKNQWMDNHTLANIAMDFEINIPMCDNFESFKKVVLNTGGCYDEKYRGLPYEEVYRMLEKEKPENMEKMNQNGINGPDISKPQQDNNQGSDESGEESEGSGSGQGSGKESEGSGSGERTYKLKDANGNETTVTVKQSQGITRKELAEKHGKFFDPEVIEERNIQRKIDLDKAVEKNKGNSTGSNKGAGGLLNSIVELLKPKVDWRKLFRGVTKKILSIDSVKYTYRRRRTKQPLGILSRTQVSTFDKIEDVVVIVDVSGSMDYAWFEQTISEINGMLKTNDVGSLHLLFFDTEVQYVKLNQRDLRKKVYIPKDVGGSGGTLFYMPIDYMLDTLRLRYPPLVVFVTDGGDAGRRFEVSG